MRFLLLGILLLAGILGNVTCGHAQQKDPKASKDSSKDSPKDSSKDPTEPPKITYSTEIAGKNLHAWISDLKDMRDPSTRDKAVCAIMLYGKAAQDYAGLALLDRLKDTDIGVRSKAILALGVVGVPLQDTAKLIDGLADRLNLDQQVLVRYHAVAMLARFGSDARLCIPVLISRSTDTQAWEIRKMCLFVLGKAGQGDSAKKIGPDPRAVSAALNGLRDPCALVRMEAASALYSLGPPSDAKQRQETLNHIQQRILVEKHTDTQIWLYMARLKLDDYKEDALKDLTKLLKEKDPQVREQAVNALAALADKARPALGEVLDLITNDKEPPVVYAAVLAAWKVGGDNGKIIGALTQLQKRTDLPDDSFDVLKKISERVIKLIKEGKKPM